MIDDDAKANVETLVNIRACSSRKDADASPRLHRASKLTKVITMAQSSRRRAVFIYFFLTSNLRLTDTHDAASIVVVTVIIASEGNMLRPSNFRGKG